MPELGQRQQGMGMWHANRWSLRTKVAVVLMLPAVVALILGGIRVQAQLDDASRLSAVRDQVGVLRDSVTLSDLVIAEMVAALEPNGADAGSRRAAVDERATALRQAADFARLPADVSRSLNDALNGLNALRVRAAEAGADPISQIAGYLEVINRLGDVVPGIVSVARTEEFDNASRAVTSLLRLRAVAAVEETLARFTGPTTAAIAAAAQRVAAEESLLVSQVRRDIPASSAAAFESVVSSAQVRLDALDTLRGELLTALSDNVSARTNQVRSDALRDAAIVLGALLAALAIALIVARSLLSPVRTLRSAALAAAHHQLPETVERVHAGEQVDWKSIEPVPVHTGEEIGQLARAFDEMHQQAVRLAGEQAELRRQISEMFTTLSRRSQSLVELQLEVIDELESDEQNPKRLDGLFRLDHLATRLRRNGENLQVLAGGSPARPGQAAVTVVELLRAATSEVDDYRRVELGHAPNGSIRGAAAPDIVHILAELLENATRYSPPQRKVMLTADRGAEGGLLIEVVDGGLGMAADDLAAANQRLASSIEVGPETTRRMGLFVVSKLAERHGVTVRLRPTYDSAKQAGITASVHVPAALIIAGARVDAPTKRATPAIPTAPAIPTPVIATTPAIATPAAPEQPARNWFVAAVPNGTTLPAAPSPRPSPVTSAGLPLRKPGARVVPIGPEPTPAKPAAANFRDAESIRSNLSRHYDGVRAARLRTETKSEAREGQ